MGGCAAGGGAGSSLKPKAPIFAAPATSASPPKIYEVPPHSRYRRKVPSPVGSANLRRNPPDFSALTVLVVEDHTDSRDLMREVLQSCGASVLEADNVRTAQEYVSTLKLDLIVTDLALPGGDGASFLRWLREQPGDRGGTLPAIVVTAYQERYPPAEVTGWAAYFRKPLDVDEFVRTIAAIFRRPGANR